jgi:spore coat protein CotH
MNKMIILTSLLLLANYFSAAQTTLFDEKKVNKIHITIPKSDLQTILQNPQQENYYKADFVFETTSKRDTVKNIGFRLRGNTSRGAEKKSFRISFNEFLQGGRFQGVKKLNVNGSHNDPTMIREKLFYHCWAKFGLPERRSAFIRFYINGEYYGIYTLLEEIDKDFCEREFGNNGGNLYKCRYPADLQYLGDDATKYKKVMHSSTERAYDLKTNETADDYSDLVNLCKQISQNIDENYEDNLHKVLNVNNYLKALALEVMAGHWDDYTYNKNNYFLYKNNKTGKFEFISYDADNTFGVDWVNQDWAKRDVNVWFPTQAAEKRPLTKQLLNVDNFNQLYLKYLDSVATYIMHPDSIFPYIDRIHSSIRPFVASDPFYPKDYGYSLQSFLNGLTKSVDGHTPYGIKPFISTRIQTMKQQTISTNEIPTQRFKLRIIPNPSSDTIHLNTDYQGTIKVKVYSQDGRLLKYQRFDSAMMSYLSISDLPKGYYELVMESENGAQVAAAHLVKI